MDGNPVTEPQAAPAPEPVDVSKEVGALLELLDEHSRPNLNALSQVARNLPGVMLNLKFYGYELARRMAEALPPAKGLRPRRMGLAWKPSTQADLEADWSRYWTQELKCAHVFHRKVWELAYVLQALHDHDLIRPGARGLGFGCGEEAIPSYLASKGVRVTITDLAPDHMAAAGWADTAQHTATLDQAYRDYLVDRATFERNAELRYVDMNAIPEDLSDYDFCWSICAFEHLGSIRQGMDFVENTMATLRPGGVSVHTTEFNFWNEVDTIDNWGTVLFQRRHFQELADRLRAQGHKVRELDFDVGAKPLDKFIDLPPYLHDWPRHMRESWGEGSNHLKLMIDGFACTCFGLIVEKG